MKSAEAIIRVEKATDVKNTLIKNDFSAISFSTLVGRGE